MSSCLTYRIDGPAESSRLPLLLGSSIGTDAAMWAAAVPVLARDRAVVRWNLPGHGGSPADLVPTDGSATVADFAAALLALADGLGIATFDYAGDSFGGAIGAYLAAHHPDRVNALAICCSSAHFGDPASWRARAKKVREEGAAAMAELGDTAPNRWFPAESPARSWPETAELIATHKAVDSLGYAACCDAIAAVDLTPVLAGISAPTLVVAGRGDPATPPVHARELADGIPGSGLIELPGIGHLAPFEAPQAVANELLTHFSGARFDAGMAVRRQVLGDAHVDRANARITPFTQPFQDLITRYAWGEIWTRPGLDRRTRSCITLTALVAHGHLEELAMHVRAACTNGLTPDEIGEVLLQTAIYCGVPAANSAFAVAQRVLDEMAAPAAAQETRETS
ncbi:4-carboxymuconolactone decarboxylase [Actinospica sp. MGRD01-02]|uniref:4-carboxymuconolactone decarboxylase n=1 Tax=Actinospica acidithermotolerans TaxID=2828514 RepID=A0A941IK66_9ACTN|nr:4-carboxymuconolactone decarboxylase [Actinospica acidithermotolerans]MBR7830219.1 4-carboxymuconolactone decarboxylase [Actinospica acidithermotolerans]